MGKETQFGNELAARQLIKIIYDQKEPIKLQKKISRFLSQYGEMIHDVKFGSKNAVYFYDLILQHFLKKADLLFLQSDVNSFLKNILVGRYKEILFKTKHIKITKKSLCMLAVRLSDSKSE